MGVADHNRLWRLLFCLFLTGEADQAAIAGRIGVPFIKYGIQMMDASGHATAKNKHGQIPCFMKEIRHLRQCIGCILGGGKLI